MTSIAVPDAASAPASGPASRVRRPALAAGAACLAVALLSLIMLDQPSYDPMAWLIWGRQISEGTLHTMAGPSWKPLPVLVTAPAALLGDGPAPLVWLAVARAGGLIGLVLAYRLAARYGGRAGGIVAVVALLLTETFVQGVLRGNSEGLLVAIVLLALDRRLLGHRHQAFALGVAAALLRPEAWPLLALYVLWMLYDDRRAGRSPWPTVTLAAGFGALVLAAWLVPEKIGSGDFLRAASRAREPVADSPAQADRPFVAVFTNAAPMLAYPVYALGVLAVIDAWHRRRAGVLAIAALSTVWMVLVAILAELGFTGNMRYVTLPAALVCVLAGVGTGVLVRLAGRRAWVLAVALLAAVPGIVLSVSSLHDELTDLASDERFYDALPAAIARAGGEAAVRDCGSVYTGPYQTQNLAWELHLREDQIDLKGAPPGTVLARPGNPLTRDQRFPTVHARAPWTVRSSC